VQKRSILLKAGLYSLEKTQIIFVMLSIFLTGNFSDPFISTGMHLISFYLEKHGVEE
jgi:hypothetical protein